MTESKKDQMKAMQEQMSALQERMNKLQADIEREAKESSKWPLWMPEQGEEYWYVSVKGVVLSRYWAAFDFDKYLLAMGNMYKTEKEAERARDKQKLIVELHRWAAENDTVPEGGWQAEGAPRAYQLALTARSKTWGYMIISNVALRNVTGLPNFTSEDKVHDCIAHFGDRLNLLLG